MYVKLQFGVLGIVKHVLVCVRKIAIRGLGIVCVRKIAIRGFGDSEAYISMCT